MAFLLKVLSLAVMVTGIFALFFQTLELILFRSTTGLKDPDIVSVGVWGGIFLLLFGILLLANWLKTSKSIQALALYGFLIGVTMIGVYSWSVNRYQHAVPNCSNIKISNNNLTLCSRVALDSLMIICGILTVGLNVAVAFMASAFKSD